MRTQVTLSHPLDRFRDAPQRPKDTAGDERQGQQAGQCREGESEREDQPDRSKLRLHPGEGKSDPNDAAVQGRQRDVAEWDADGGALSRGDPDAAGEGLADLGSVAMILERGRVSFGVRQHDPVGPDDRDARPHGPAEPNDALLERPARREGLLDGAGLGHQRIRQLVHEGVFEHPVEDDRQDEQDPQDGHDVPEEEPSRQGARACSPLRGWHRGDQCRVLAWRDFATRPLSWFRLSEARCHPDRRKGDLERASCRRSCWGSFRG